MSRKNVVPEHRNVGTMARGRSRRDQHSPAALNVSQEIAFELGRQRHDIGKDYKTIFRELDARYTFNCDGIEGERGLRSRPKRRPEKQGRSRIRRFMDEKNLLRIGSLDRK